MAGDAAVATGCLSRTGVAGCRTGVATGGGAAWCLSTTGKTKEEFRD